MPKGAKPGERRGGRSKGTPNKRTEKREQAMQEAAEKISAALGAPFEGDAHALLMTLYKDTAQPLDIRLDAAKAAIGYEKPRLSSVDANIDGTLGHYESQPIPVEERHSDAVASAKGPAVSGDSA